MRILCLTLLVVVGCDTAEPEPLLRTAEFKADGAGDCHVTYAEPTAEPITVEAAALSHVTSFADDPDGVRMTLGAACAGVSRMHLVFLLDADTLWQAAWTETETSAASYRQVRHQFTVFEDYVWAFGMHGAD